MTEPQALPAGFLARTVAWSLDAVPVALGTALLTWSTIGRALDALRVAWAQLQQAVLGAMGAVLGQAADPAALANRLIDDPAIRAAGDAFDAAMRGLLLPPLGVFLVLGALYWIGFERSSWQATPGKRALGLRVETLGGQSITLRHALLRHVAGALSWLTLNLGHALAAVPPHKRALHDWIAGTRVVHADAGPRLPVWAKAWIVLLLLLAIGLPSWLAVRYLAALQLLLH